MSRERPIIFSAPMVQAIEAGRKTQTRRVVKGPLEFLGAGGKAGPDWDDPSCWGWADEYGDFHTLAPDGQSSCDPGCTIACPYGAPGDRLWVRETWALVCADEDGIDDWVDRGPIPDALPWPGWQVWYRAGHSWAYDHPDDRGFRWRPSIHMPRWASRITLEITSVRVERLQEIGPLAAEAEGFPLGADSVDPVFAFRALWDQINGKTFPWDSNPWVWAIEFCRLTPTPNARGVPR